MQILKQKLLTDEIRKKGESHENFLIFIFV